MKNDNEIPIGDFENSIFNNDLKKISEDITEALLDTVMEDGFFKEMPIVGTLIGFYKANKSFKLRAYIKNLLKFLNELKDITPDEKELFIGRINTDQKGKEDLFERLLFIIEKIDDTYKAKVIGRLFVNYVNGKIDKNCFLKLSYIVDKLYYKDLIYFHYLNSGHDSKSFEIGNNILRLEIDNRAALMESFIGLGLYIVKISEDNKRYLRGGSSDIKFIRENRISAIGEMLNIYGFNPEKPWYDID